MKFTFPHEGPSVSAAADSIRNRTRERTRNRTSDAVQRENLRRPGNPELFSLAATPRLAKQEACAALSPPHPVRIGGS